MKDQLTTRLLDYVLPDSAQAGINADGFPKPRPPPLVEPGYFFLVIYHNIINFHNQGSFGVYTFDMGT